MSERDRYARSFGPIADAYERNRPPYAEAAIDWIAQRLPLRDVLDLAAGTGKLTRQLVERGARVVAVEPDPDMRATFARVLPGVEILDGRAEAIPLEDGTVDVVAVGQAFHWFDADEALSEMRRVTRGGGGFALLWNEWSQDDEVLGAIDELLVPNRAPLSPYRPFEGLDRRRFAQPRTLSAEQLVGWAASTSGFVNAPPAEQERIARRIREIVGGPEATVTITTDVLVLDRE